MSNEVLIEAENVSKKFCRSLKRSFWYGVKDIATEITGRERDHDTLREGEFWAVKDVSFQVRRGECLGLIGPNGAGKTTLLRMLNGLIKPDKGKITMHGRVGALIALGVGFNPILTGRENVYAAGAVLGLTTKEIDGKYDDIVEFAELAEFMETPVQNYSSGMQVRLGFSVAAQIEPDILILDEVLAVGDVGFRSKCYSLLNKIKNKSTLVFVSHSMPQIGRLSTKCLLMQNGSAYFYGKTNDAINDYYDLFKQTSINQITGSGKLTIEKIDFFNGGGVSLEENQGINFGDQLVIKIIIHTYESKIINAHLSIVFFNMDEALCAECTSSFQNEIIKISDYPTTTLRIQINQFPLTQGQYKISFILRSKNEIEIYDWKHLGYSLKVNSTKQGGAPVQLLGIWSYE